MHNVGRNIAPEPEFRFKWKRAYNSKLVYFSCSPSLLTTPEDKSNFVEESKKNYRWVCISRNALGFHWLNTLSMGWGNLFFCGVKAPWGRTTIPDGYLFLKEQKEGKKKHCFLPEWSGWMVPACREMFGGCLVVGGGGGSCNGATSFSSRWPTTSSVLVCQRPFLHVHCSRVHHKSHFFFQRILPA